ncbi:hypothetical protein MYX65_01550 [Acidobacteria bacterium AH-259-L09]|nr:hypothetical protein [Acidobacteria bacterium AH-259-L09]
MRGEVKERGGGDAGTSATRSDTEIARNPHQPEGWRRDGVDFFVTPPPRYTPASRRRRFANSTPSRSSQTSSYLRNEALSLDRFFDAGQVKQSIEIMRLKTLVFLKLPPRRGITLPLECTADPRLESYLDHVPAQVDRAIVTA